MDYPPRSRTNGNSLHDYSGSIKIHPETHAVYKNCHALRIYPASGFCPGQPQRPGSRLNNLHLSAYSGFRDDKERRKSCHTFNCTSLHSPGCCHIQYCIITFRFPVIIWLVLCWRLHQNNRWTSDCRNRSGNKRQFNSSLSGIKWLQPAAATE